MAGCSGSRFGDMAIPRRATERASWVVKTCPKGGLMPECPLDAAGRRRSPATLPGFHAGRPPHNKGMRYPADPPTVEEIVAAAFKRVFSSGSAS